RNVDGCSWDPNCNQRPEQSDFAGFASADLLPAQAVTLLEQFIRQAGCKEHPAFCSSCNAIQLARACNCINNPENDTSGESAVPRLAIVLARRTDFRSHVFWQFAVRGACLVRLSHSGMEFGGRASPKLSELSWSNPRRLPLGWHAQRRIGPLRWNA